MAKIRSEPRHTQGEDGFDGPTQKRNMQKDFMVLFRVIYALRLNAKSIGVQTSTPHPLSLVLPLALGLPLSVYRSHSA